MKKARQTPHHPNLTRALWTFSALLLILLAASMADAQGIDKLKCNDIDGTEKRLRLEIVKQIREAQSKGLSPDRRGEQQAASIASALFAAVKNPQKAADTASESISGNPKRRATVNLHAKCAGEPYKKVAENQYYSLAGYKSACASTQAPPEASVNFSQVHQTSMVPLDVTLAFARSKMTSAGKNTTEVCKSPCTNGAYAQVPQSFVPSLNKDYFIRDTTKFTHFPGVRPMVNETAMKITEIPDVCGSKIYLVTGFLSRSYLGFDQASLVGVVAPIGNKTLVIGDFTAQGAKPQGWPQDLVGNYTKDMIDFVFEGYGEIAESIGNLERPVNGEIGGRPGYIQKRSLPVASAQ